MDNNNNTNFNNNDQNQYNSPYSNQYNGQYSNPNYNNQGYGNPYGAPNNNGYNDGYYYQQAMKSIEEQNRLNESNAIANSSMVFGIIALATTLACYGLLLTPLWAILAIVKGAKAQNLAFPNPVSTKAKIGKIFGIVSLGVTAFIWGIMVFVIIISVYGSMFY